MSLLDKIHESPLLGLAAGMLYSALSNLGIMQSGHETDFIGLFAQMVNGLVAAYTIYGYFNHKTETDKIKLKQAQIKPLTTPIS